MVETLGFAPRRTSRPPGYELGVAGAPGALLFGRGLRYWYQGVESNHGYRCFKPALYLLSYLGAGTDKVPEGERDAEKDVQHEFYHG